MKKVLVCIFLVFLIIPLYSQNLGPDEELYLADPDPRFNGDQVRDLQRFLLFHHEDIGVDGVDGWFGRDTHNALLSYQKNHGLETSGRIKTRDIPMDLHWAPLMVTYLFSGWMEGPFPSSQNDLDIEVIKPDSSGDISYGNRLGHVTVEKDFLTQNGIESILLSPDKRFLAAHSSDGSTIYLWDIVSGRRLSYPLEETAKDSTYQYQPDKHINFQLEEVYWWNNRIAEDPYTLNLVVSFTFERAPYKDRSLFCIMPFAY